MLIIILLLNFGGCKQSNVIKNNTPSNDKIYILKYNTREKSVLNSGWENYLPIFFPSAKKDLSNNSIDEVNLALGDPYISMKNVTSELQNKREIYIYLIGGNKEGGDNSALYIYFVANKVSKYKIDDFSGDVLEDALPSYLNY